MRNLRRSGARAFYVLTLLAFLSAPTIGLAQSDSAMIPDNTNAKTYGSGWECKEGYQERDGDCTAIKLPANSYSTNFSYGNGWKCSRGYRESDETCVAIEIPANAYLNASGDSWECERGFRQVKGACPVIKVPANGYLADTSYSTGWVCERGFRAAEDACVAIELPENAHFDYSGNDWDCDRPYLRQHLGCRLP